MLLDSYVQYCFTLVKLEKSYRVLSAGPLGLLSVREILEEGNRWDSGNPCARGAAIIAAVTAGLVAFGGASAAANARAHAAGQTNVSAAKAAIAPYTGHPTPIPVSTPLPHKLRAGTKFAYLQCVTPVCGIYAELIGAAVHEIGGQLTVVKAGASSQQLQSAFASILSGKPGAIILAGIEPDSVRTQLQQAVRSHIPVVSVGIVNSAHYHISAGILRNRSGQAHR